MNDDYDETHSARPNMYPAHSQSSPYFKIDEGFAESQVEDNERSNFQETASSFVSWVQTLSEETRAEIALEVLRTLRTSNIASVVEKLTPLLYMDPIAKLPPEITWQVFSYLDAPTLLTASLSSRTWRERILDPRLWQTLYRSEGWGVDLKRLRDFEEEHAKIMRAEMKGKSRGQMRSSIGKGPPLFKRRATSDWLDSRPRNVSSDVAQWRDQHGTVEADPDPMESVDQEMTDVAFNTQESPSRPNKRHSRDSGDDMDYIHVTPAMVTRESSHLSRSPSQLRNSLLTQDSVGDIKINWPYLYEQRHKLEDNWQKARFINFQLPHPQHPYEAHTECVYTIQFCGKWLVSGSRDKTLRVWDLETRRLRGNPLVGHSQSVLCLQFDPTEDEDVIISGRTDSGVIVWKFSTGQKLHTIQSAHEESVLNLKFDKRYLVTCSKDKKIKVWNRTALSPLDAEYPKIAANSNARVPSYIIDLSLTHPVAIEAKLANGQIKLLQPYSNLMTLEGHQAAVNAIQINGDLIVSASGDRMIRVWNVKTGVCVRAIGGHLKGIACVQFDSRRIVSGSSDNSVRIYDPLTAAEVAVLNGHSNLVRTVQAGFGDLPGSEEEDLLKAREAEKSYLKKLESGEVVEDRQYMRRLRNGEEGSSRTAIGSNLPPGGGGSKWARIVSGSYDESIIIWKKDPKGNWVVGHMLKQNDAVRASDESDRAGSEAGQTAVPGPGRRIQPSQRQNTATSQAISASQIVHQAVNASMAGLQNSLLNVVGLRRGPSGSRQSSGRSNQSTAPPNTPNNLAPAVQTAINQATAQTQAAVAQAMRQAAVSGGSVNMSFTHSITSTRSVGNGESSSVAVQPPSIANISIPPQQQISSQEAEPSLHRSQLLNTPVNQQIQPTTAPPPAPTAAAPTPQQLMTQAWAAPAVPPGLAPPDRGNANVSRVFKLQFDSRRIVCCSQDSRIVGWDFANGDPEIEAVAGFFLGP